MTPRIEERTMERKLSRKAAWSAYLAVCERLFVEPAAGPVRQGEGGWEYDRPMLVEDFEDRRGWAIVWEGDDWSYIIAANPEQGSTVYMEPYNGWALSLYPV